MIEDLTIGIEHFVASYFGDDFLKIVRTEDYGLRMLFARLRRLVQANPDVLEFLVEKHPWLLFAVDTHTCDACTRVGWKTVRRHRTWRKFFPCLRMEWRYYDKQWQAARLRIELFMMQEGLKSALPLNPASHRVTEQFLGLLRKIQGRKVA